MSFLIVVPRGQSKVFLEESLLAKSLCPYHGPLEKRVQAGSQIYCTSIAEMTPQGLALPRGHQGEKCSAWVNVEFTENRILITTDPLGQCPIWFVETSSYILISPEQKAFRAVRDFNFSFMELEYFLSVQRRYPVGRDFKEIQRLPPGSTLTVMMSPMRLVIQKKDLPWDQLIEEDPEMSTEAAQDLLLEALKLAATDLPSSNSVSLLSGGIDSSVATVLAKNIEMTYNLKTEIGDEEKESQETSAHLGLRSKTLHLDTQNLLPLFKTSIFENEITDGLTAEIILQLKAIVDLLPKNHQNVVTGYGADLLFGGMLGHQGYLAVTGVCDTKSLLDRTFWSKEFSPFYYWSKNKRFFNIYWHPEVMKAAMKIPLLLQQQKVGTEKFILRSLAVRENWLPSKFAYRTKTGMTNGTNVNVLLSQLLNLKDAYSYGDKTEMAFSHFQSIFK